MNNSIKKIFEKIKLGVMISWIASFPTLCFSSSMAKSSTFDMTITTLQDISDLQTYVEESDSHTLVILDVDYTVTQPSFPAFQYGNFRSNFEFIKKVMKYVTQFKSEFSTSMVTKSEPRLIDKNIHHVLEKFHSRGTKILALSAILTGRWNTIEDTMDWRQENLSKYKLPLTDFGLVYKFKELPSYKGNYPEVKKGILLTNGEQVSKHDLLDAFLKKINWFPNKIIFVDDTRSLIESMSLYAREKGILFKGFEYQGARNAEFVPLSQQEFQNEWNNLLREIGIPPFS